MYLKIRDIKKFTTKSEIERIIGKPKFQIGNRLVYYYGKGLLIAYCLRCFYIHENERIEYGEEGMYATNIYYFFEEEMLKAHFRINDFEGNDIERDEKFIIEENMTCNTSFEDIHQIMKKKENVKNYREGETRVMVDGKIKVQNLFIMYENYTYFFLGNSKKNRISGFQYTLSEA